MFGQYEMTTGELALSRRIDTTISTAKGAKGVFGTWGSINSVRDQLTSIVGEIQLYVVSPKKEVITRILNTLNANIGIWRGETSRGTIADRVITELQFVKKLFAVTPLMTEGMVAEKPSVPEPVVTPPPITTAPTPETPPSKFGLGKIAVIGGLLLVAYKMFVGKKK